MKAIQYTIRQVPFQVDKVLRETALEENKSLNEAVLEALIKGAGLSETKSEYHDLDALAGTWKNDKKFDDAIQAQDQIDPDLWR